MGREEQREEREVLESIFPQEITGETDGNLFKPTIVTARKKTKTKGIPPI